MKKPAKTLLTPYRAGDIKTLSQAIEMIKFLTDSVEEINRRNVDQSRQFIQWDIPGMKSDIAAAAVEVDFSLPQVSGFEPSNYGDTGVQWTDGFSIIYNGNTFSFEPGSTDKRHVFFNGYNGELLFWNDEDVVIIPKLYPLAHRYPLGVVLGSLVPSLYGALILADTIGSAQIVAGAITADKLAADIVYAGDLRVTGQSHFGDDGSFIQFLPAEEEQERGRVNIEGDIYLKGDISISGTDLTGPEGPQGEKGDKGDKGDTGSTGATGSQGQKGDKGDKGSTGATGAKGDKGNTGAQGPRGNKTYMQNSLPTDAISGDYLQPTGDFSIYKAGKVYKYNGSSWTKLSGGVTASYIAADVGFLGTLGVNQVFGSNADFTNVTVKNLSVTGAFSIDNDGNGTLDDDVVDTGNIKDGAINEIYDFSASESVSVFDGLRNNIYKELVFESAELLSGDYLCILDILVESLTTNAEVDFYCYTTDNQHVIEELGHDFETYPMKMLRANDANQYILWQDGRDTEYHNIIDRWASDQNVDLVEIELVARSLYIPKSYLNTCTYGNNYSGDKLTRINFNFNVPPEPDLLEIKGIRAHKNLIPMPLNGRTMYIHAGCFETYSFKFNVSDPRHILCVLAWPGNSGNVVQGVWQYNYRFWKAKK